jgi:hypothetical protein
MFLRNILPPYSGFKSEPRKQPGRSKHGKSQSAIGLKRSPEGTNRSKEKSDE